VARPVGLFDRLLGRRAAIEAQNASELEQFNARAARWEEERGNFERNETREALLFDEALPGCNAGVRTLSCAEQFRAMAFAQLTWRESLRDIEVSLSANASKLYAMGFRAAVKRSTLADANESRDWRIWFGSGWSTRARGR